MRRSCMLLATTAVFTLLVVTAAAAPAATPGASRPSVAPSGTAPPSRTLYVALPSGGIVALDAASGAQIGTVPVASPDAVAISPDGSRGYALNSLRPSVFDTATNTVIGQIFGVGAPDSIAVNSSGTRLALGSRGSTRVLIVDTSTLLVVDHVDLSLGTCALAFSPGGTSLYVGGCAATAGTTAVSLVDLRSRQITTIPEDLPTADLKVTPDGTRLVVETCGALQTIDTTTAAVVRTLSFTGCAGPLAVEVSGDIAVPACETTPFGQTCSTDQLDPTTGELTTAITSDCGGQTIATGDGSQLFVIDQGFLSSHQLLVPNATTGGCDQLGTVTGLFGPMAITPDQAPQAHVLVHGQLYAGDPVTFDASPSTAAYGTIVLYGWSFGDGTTAVTTTPTVTHTYAHRATYPVTLTETDSLGTSTARLFDGRQVISNGGSSARLVVPVTLSGSALSVTWKVTAHATPGGAVGWQIVLTNLGPDPTSADTQLLVLVPNGVDAVVANPVGGRTILAGGRLVRWTVGAILASGQSKGFTITGVIDASVPPGTDLTTAVIAAPSTTPSASIRVTTIAVS